LLEEKKFSLMGEFETAKIKAQIDLEKKLSEPKKPAE